MCYNEEMTKTCQTLAAILFLMCFIKPSMAIELQFPVACRLMSDCWITNHVDLNNNINQIEDYMCGQKGTDNNKSTHISLGSKGAMEKNIPAIAAADGIIKTAENIGGFCGNRVLIDHGKGWESSYCHLKPETIIVKPNQKVKQGQILGAIGMSGQADWPRLSYAIMRNGMVFDPFSGGTTLEGCNPKAKPMWISGVNPPYEPAHVTSIGFTVGTVSNAQILNGTVKSAAVIMESTPQLSLYSLLMNIQKGDDITMKIIEPSGRILNEAKIIADSDRNYYPIYFSTMRQNRLWDKGNYRGMMTVTRRVHGNLITTGQYTSVELR